MLGEYEEALNVAERSLEVLPGDQAIHLEMIKALAALGREAEVNRLLDERLSFPSGTPGVAMQTAALEFRAHGYHEASQRSLDRALSWFAERPAVEAETFQRRTDLAYTFFLAERWTDAEALYRELYAENPESVIPLWGLGAIAAVEGNREEAQRMSEALAALDTSTLRGRNIFERACLFALLGEQERAVNLLREAHGQGQHFSPSWHYVTEFERLRGFEPFDEFMRPKP